MDFALACNYIDIEKKKELENKSKEVGKLINYMIKNPDKFGI
ncbi:hypothetical protein ACIVBQ_002815 [Tenacibaculum discolor]